MVKHQCLDRDIDGSSLRNAVLSCLLYVLFYPPLPSGYRHPSHLSFVRWGEVPLGVVLFFCFILFSFIFGAVSLAVKKNR